MTNSPTLPATAALRLSFDIEALAADLRALADHAWQPETPYAATGPSEPLTPDWTALPLRSQGGDPTRTDPGGPGLHEFSDTPLIERVPNLRTALRALPCELRGARLLALAPGGAVEEHTDPHHGLDVGHVRLHVPIATNPRARMLLDGQWHHWTAGRLWYGDFSRLHALRNDGATTRVHLVVDCLVNEALIALFPDDFRARLSPLNTLLNRPPRPLTSSEGGAYLCDFTLPTSLMGRLHDGQEGHSFCEGWIGYFGHDLCLYVDGVPAFALVHLGGGEFRFAGWTEERTVVVRRIGSTSYEIALRFRTASKIREVTRPAAAATQVPLP
ncbi:aspartyl/asparaginyl beta-hydroxylase domain-containing protein [Nonomuraea sp. NPDC050536]|uniref:aspartyl/asparaginyl beta-hydroxylase domain-containing protein n=1 Tax=Nonomuraea sp. NPDC050536 TaxID=3364366 RepID=UPI0037CC2463